MNKKYEVQQLIGGEWLTMFVRPAGEALRIVRALQKSGQRARIVR